MRKSLIGIAVLLYVAVYAQQKLHATTERPLFHMQALRDTSTLDVEVLHPI